MIKPSLAALAVATLASAAVSLPPAQAADGMTSVQIATCEAAKNAPACEPCNPCAAARNPCNPCAATACNPCNPCAVEASNPCNP